MTGGAEVFYRETERVLRANGHETLMIATGEDADRGGADNLLLLDAPAYDTGGALSKVRALPSAIWDGRKKSAVKKALKDFDADLLHVFAINVHLSPSIVFAAKELGIPVVGTFNDYKHICPNYKLFHHGRICYDCKGYNFAAAIRNRCCKDNRVLSVASALEAYLHRKLDVYGQFDHFTFSSDFLAEMTGEFWEDRSFSWSKLLNPFDSRSFEAGETYEPFGLYFGRLIDEKGVDRLVEAARLVPDFRIKIVGDGPDMDRLKAIASAGHGNIEFLGPMWSPELDSILSKARFVVVPSIWHENFPYVINQSFALGRPVIGADRGGITELVSHGKRGLIFDPDQPEAIAACIRELAVDEDKARQMGRRAKAYSDDLFNDENFYTDLRRAYEAAGCDFS
nr:glycosyltransferase family 4 protein [Qipengyuania mesophila]